MQRDEVEKRIRKLEDVEEIKRLKALYCSYCDVDYDPEKLASLFVIDAVWDGGAFGRYEGREAIRAYFESISRSITFAVHYVTNPIIEVEGDRATGSWYLHMAGTFSVGNRAFWGSGRYDDEYVRENGIWKYRFLRLTSHYWTPFEEGWAKAAHFVPKADL